MAEPHVTKVTAGLKNHERWFVPIACLFVLLAEYSRYLTATRIGAAVFSPKNMVAAGVLALVAWAFFALRTKANRAQAGKWSLLVLPVALIAWVALSALWADYPERTPALLEWLVALALILLIGIAARPVQGSKWVATTLVVAVLGVVVVGLVEKTTDTHLPLSNLHNPYRQQWAISSVFIGQNHLAASLGLLLPLVAGFGLAWHGWRRWLSLATLAGGLVALFFTGSSLALVATGVAAVIFWLVAIVRAKPKMRGRLFFVALLSVLGLVAVWTLTPAAVKERVSVASLGVKQSFEARRALIAEGFDLIWQAPIRGLGPGATNELVEVTVGNQPTLRALHNLSLEFTVTFGLVAAIALAIWLGYVLVRVAKRLRGKGQRWPSVGILASVAALVIIQAVPSTFEGVRAPWITIGLALALAMRPSSHDAHRS